MNWQITTRLDNDTFTCVFNWNGDGKLASLHLMNEPEPETTRVDSVFSALTVEQVRDVRSLQTYFADGAPLPTFIKDRLDWSSFTPFQKLVFEKLLTVPHGQTRTYAWIASRIGQPGASRAVGQALRRNPFPIVLPCHRVVGKDHLGGFMGDQDPESRALQLKSSLLALEDRYVNPVFSFFSCAG